MYSIQQTKVLRKIDIFGQPINLNLDLRSKYQSVIGGMVSLIIVMLLTGYSVNEIIGYTVNRGIQITQQTNFNYNPDLLQLNSSNFIFAIHIEQEDFINQPQFNVQLASNLGETYQLKKCTSDQFLSVIAGNLELQFDVSEWLCPSSEFLFSLEGSSMSTLYKNLIIEIVECKNVSSWGAQCVEATTQNWQFSLLTKNTYINPFSDEFVAKDYLDVMTCSFQPGELQQVEYSFDKHITKDFQGQIKIQGWLDEESMNIFSTNHYSKSYGGTNNSVWARVMFSRSHFSTTYTREYQTITDLLSKIGGLSQSVISIVGVIITYYNRAQFYLDISNRLYDYQFNQEDQGGTKSGVDQLQFSGQMESGQPLKKKRRSEPEQDSLEEDPQYKERVLKVVEEQKQIMEKYQFKSRKHFLLASFQQTILMKQTIKLNCKYFFYKLRCKKANPKQDPKLYLLQKALTSVREELDVFSILNRIHQVEKLKQTLLDRDQLILFNYSPKPVIAINDKDKETNFLYYSKQQTLKQMSLIEVAEDIRRKLKNQFLSREHLSIENVYNSYKAVASKNKKSNRYYYKINRKLKQFLGDQVKAIFKASKLLRFPEDDIAEALDEVLSVPVETAVQMPIRVIK